MTKHDPAPTNPAPASPPPEPPGSLEEALARCRRAEEIYRLLMLGVRDYAIIILDTEGKVAEWNEGAVRLFGYPAEEITGRHFAEFFTEEDRQGGRPERELREAATAGRALDENWAVRKDGSRFWASGVMESLRDEAGNLRGYAKVVRDLTERKLAEELRERLRAREARASEAAEAAQERTTRILESITDAFFTVDRSWRFTYLNPEAERLLRRSREEVLGKNLWSEFPEAVGSRWFSEYHRALAEGVPVELEEYAANLERWFDVRAYPSEEGLAVYLRDVTDRKQVAEALRESEERFRILAETASDAIILIDAADIIQYANPATERLFGYAVAELQGRELTVLMPERFRDRHRAGFQRYLDTGVRQVNWAGVEFSALHRDGREIPVEVSFGEQQVGARHLFAGIVRDITDRKRAEEALRQSNQLLQAVSEGTGDPVFVKDRDGRCLLINNAGAKLFGRTPEDVIGRLDHELLPPDADRAVRQRDLEIMARGKSETFEETLVFHGQPRTFLTTKGPYRDPDGAVIGIYAVARDITERKRAEEALRESEERLAGVVGSVMDAIITVDEDLRIVLFNEAAEKMLRVPAAEAIGQDLNRYLPERFRNAHDTHIHRFGDTGITRREMGAVGAVGPLFALRADGEEFPIEASISQVTVGGRKLYTVVKRDITERVRSEAALQARERQQAAVAELGQQALAGADLDSLFHHACERLTGLLEVEYAKVLELLPGGEALLLRAGTGWQPGLVGRATVGGGRDSQAGYTLLSREPVIVEDLREETRFQGPALLHDHGVISGVSVIIGPPDRPFGVLGAHTPRRHAFSLEDTRFLQGVANVLYTAIERRRAEEALWESQERFRLLVEGVEKYAIISLDVAGRVNSWNSGAQRLYGYLEEEVLGKHFSFLFPPELAEQAEEELQVAAGAGRWEGEGWRVRKNGSRFWADIFLAVLRDETGRPHSFVKLTRDATERKQAQEEREHLLAETEAARAEAETAREHAAFLAEAGRQLAASLDYRLSLEKVARLAVPRIADWCAVDVRAADGSVQRLAVVHVDPEQVEWALELGRRYPPDPDAATGVPNVLRTGEPEFYPEVPDELLAAAARDEEHLRLLRQVGFASAMIVPLEARGRTLGALVFVTTRESGRRYGPEDLEFARELARDAGLALDNVRLYEQQREIAHTLQQSLLPPELPLIPGLEVAGRYRPAYEGEEVGGDFYDLFSVDGAWTVVVGDVAGKGVEAATLTALVRYTVRASAVYEQRPGRVLARLNEAILRQGTGDRFCTVVCARLVLNGQFQLQVASGGHPPPLLLRDGAVTGLGRGGMILGVVPDAVLDEETVALRPGDMVVFYTDGVIEARDGRNLFGTRRLAELLVECAGSSAAEVAARIERAAAEFGGGATRDDIAILILRVRPAPAEAEEGETERRREGETERAVERVSG